MMVHSPDGVQIAFERSGKGNVGLVFVHGWLGNKRWWDSQRDAFAVQYQVLQLDLAGHGDSGEKRQQWSMEAYARDIEAATATLDCERIVLVGHSMSGASVVQAASMIPRTHALVLVDTLKDLDHEIAPAQLEAMFTLYRQDFKKAVEQVLPQYFFTTQSPKPVIERLTREFLEVSGARAADLLRPFYTTDIRSAARDLKLPVRAINGDLHPTAMDVCSTYFTDFDATIMHGVGHYPMLENPDAFNRHLEKTLSGLGLP
jgi:pimeloyl-ACP methyl ester carboxylesterase